MKDSDWLSTGKGVLTSRTKQNLNYKFVIPSLATILKHNPTVFKVKLAQKSQF